LGKICKKLIPKKRKKRKEKPLELEWLLEMALNNWRSPM
jgi:hypothetical protein